MDVSKQRLLRVLKAIISIFLNGTFISHIPSFTYSYLEGMWVGFILHDLKFITLDLIMHVYIYLYIYVRRYICIHTHPKWLRQITV